MSISLDFNNMMKQLIGEHGFDKSIIDSLNLEYHKKSMIEKRQKGLMDWRDLPYNQEQVCDDIINYVNSVKNDFDSFVVLGIGGSALGPISVQQALHSPFYNELSKEKRNGFPKIYVADNVDPEKLAYLFEIINVEKTLFNVITKSGSTSETLSQFMIVKDILQQKLGDNFNKNIVCTTSDSDNTLMNISKKEGFKTFIIPQGVGGRFSQLTPVGLLPACFSGIDIKKMLKGAENMDKICSNDDIYKNPAYMFAILNYLSFKNGKNMCVMMPYADSLKYISDWFAQLWAESLGKKFDNDGKIIFTGTTPIKALGTTDQHSQLQLYTEGPFDKIVVFLALENYKKTLNIPQIYKDIASISFLGGKSHNQLISTEQKATEYALLKANRPNMTLTLNSVDEFSIGELIYFFEVATAFMGELLNINAFDQPGVEEIKNATYAYFDKKGFEAKKKEIQETIIKDPAFII